MENPVKAQNFSISQVYLDLGKSYESEYDFIKAEFCYIHHEAAFQDIAKSRGFESSPNVYLGRLFLKIGTQKAIDYWKSQMERPEYKNGNANEMGFTRTVNFELDDAIKKHESGMALRQI